MKNNASIWKNVRDYKFNSLFVKNLLVLFLFALVPILTALWIGYYSYIELYRSETMRKNMTSFSEFITVSNQIFDDTTKQLAGMCLLSDIELFMYSDGENMNAYYDTAQIKRYAQIILLSKNYLQGCYICAYKSGKVVTNTMITGFDQFFDRESIIRYQQQEENLTNARMLVVEDLSGVKPVKPAHIALFYDIYFGSGQQGIAVANIDPYQFGLEAEKGDGSNFYIINGDTILYASDRSLIGQKTYELNEGGVSLQDGVYETDEYTYAVTYSQDSQLTYLSVFPEMEYPESMREYRRFIIITIVMSIILCMVLCYYISSRMYAPIGTILNKFEMASRLGTDDEQGKATDEIKYIVQAIDRSNQSKEKIEEELEQRVRMLKKAQSIALQAQINPHFIHNTLQTINSLSLLNLGVGNDVSLVATALSGMLRISLENTDNIITIQEEMQHCLLYLQIQQTRYKDKFEVVWDIPEEIRNYKTIKIILQPVVENAIYHGIKPMSGKGTIVIRGEQKEDGIYLSVNDNGIGIDAERLAQITQILSQDTIRETNHLGLANVNQRIKLYFGEEYGIRIVNDWIEGTTVILHFPKIGE